MGNDSLPHLSPNLNLNLQMLKQKSRSEMGLLNTLQATCPKCGRHLARWSWAESRPRFKCYVGACAAAAAENDAKQVGVNRRVRVMTRVTKAQTTLFNYSRNRIYIKVQFVPEENNFICGFT